MGDNRLDPSRHRELSDILARERARIFRRNVWTGVELHFDQHQHRVRRSDRVGLMPDEHVELVLHRSW